MDNIRPQDLPPVLDPLFEYLSSALPQPLYNFLFTASSFAVIILSYFIKFLSLVAALPSWKPWEWDAQTVIPPLIIFLTAYYTLRSVYRTTSFMIRMAFWFIKWFFILGVLGSSLGWLSATGSGRPKDGSVLNPFMDAIQSASSSAAGAASGPGSQGQPKSGTRRKARETKNANAYAGWQYDANSPSGQRDSFSDAQNVIEYIAKLAGRAFTGSAFDILNNAKTFLDNMAETAGNNENENIIGAGPGRGRKNKAKATGSSRKTASR